MKVRAKVQSDGKYSLCALFPIEENIVTQLYKYMFIYVYMNIYLKMYIYIYLDN